MPDKERNNKAKDETDESLSGGTVGKKRSYIEEGEDSESKGKKPKVKFIILHMLLYICDSKINLAN